jgi:hypothetical protein
MMLLKFGRFRTAQQHFFRPSQPAPAGQDIKYLGAPVFKV